MSFFSSLQGNFKSSQEDEKLTFGEIRRDDEELSDVVAAAALPPPAGAAIRRGAGSAPPPNRGGGLGRAAGVPRDSRQRLRDDRAKEHAITPVTIFRFFRFFLVSELVLFVKV